MCVCVCVVLLLLLGNVVFSLAESQELLMHRLDEVWPTFIAVQKKLTGTIGQHTNPRQIWPRDLKAIGFSLRSHHTVEIMNE